LVEKNYVETLNEFGLTTLQAKIYIILLQMGKIDATSVAKSANIARQEVYRVMPTLLKLGLAHKIINKPLQYEATPLDNGLKILLQKQKEKIGELEHQKRWLINNFHIKNYEPDMGEDDTQLMVISEILLWFNLYKKLIQRTKETIDITLPVIGVPARFSLLWLEVEEEFTTNKPLKIRLVTQLPKGSNNPSQTILDHNLFDIRYLEEPVPFGMHIYDKREFTMSISPKGGLPSLWSNNPNMLILAQNHFDLMWKKAKA
jgi:sugar-specific transcriptional regulator TrmB